MMTTGIHIAMFSLPRTGGSGVPPRTVMSVPSRVNSTGTIAIGYWIPTQTPANTSDTNTTAPGRNGPSNW